MVTPAIWCRKWSLASYTRQTGHKSEIIVKPAAPLLVATYTQLQLARGSIANEDIVACRAGFLDKVWKGGTRHATLERMWSEQNVQGMVFRILDCVMTV